MTRRHTAAALLLLLPLALSACGGGDYTTPPNRPPVANAGPAMEVPVGTSVKLNGTGTDPDQDIVSYAWTLVRPAGSQATLLNYHVGTPTFLADVAGAYVATLIVNDGTLDSTPSSVTITAK